MKRLLAIIFTSVLLLVYLSAARAEVRTEIVTYRDGDAELQGMLAWDDAIKGKRPGVMVVHEWWGLNDYAKRRAMMLAELGYVAFAADMYGKGKVTEHAKQAGEWATQINANIGHWQQRALMGLEQLRKHPQVDSATLAAIGYCFGGSTVMQMAYAGADLRGVVSFHGSLPLPNDAQAQKIHARILVAHGNADSFVKPDHIDKFRAALDQAGADWQMIEYGGAKHSFTNPDADRMGMEALAYNEAADRRSWRHMRDFFTEIFAAQP